MTLALEVFDGVVDRGELEMEMGTEGADVQLQLPSGAAFVRNFVENVDLVVDVLDEFQAREGDRLDLAEPLDVPIVPKQDGPAVRPVAAAA